MIREWRERSPAERFGQDAVRRLERAAVALAAWGVGAEALQAEPDLVEVVWIACVHAPFVAQLAARDAGRFARVVRYSWLRREKPPEVFRAQLESELGPGWAGGALEPDVFAARLRGWRACEFVRLAARECGLGHRDEVGRELSHLADTAFDAAVRYHDRALAESAGEPLEQSGDAVRRASFAVIGMGKLGGEELNFGSDVDVVYIYSSDEGAAGKLTLHEYFDKLARRVTHAIDASTEDDPVFRVDLRLRPEGGRGPLVNALGPLERYYETWGRPWERQAWVKARACGGDRALGEAALRALVPFVWPRSIGPDVVSNVQELNRRIKAELVSDAEPGAPGWDVKLGVGGIREIEFFVQALQMVHGGRLPALRERSTRKALDKLLFVGLVAERERRTLADAYELLRHVEHLVQLDSGRQTQKLPSEAEAYECIARRAGFESGATFRDALAATSAAVAEIFATLGGGDAVSPDIAALLDTRDGPDTEMREKAALGALGFRDPEQAHRHLVALRRRPSSPLGAAATPEAARLAPRLLAELSASPDPDQALRALVDFTRRAGASGAHWRMLDENRALLRLVASLFGTSTFLSRAFVDQPELLDALLLAGRAGTRRTRDDLAQAIDARLGEVAGDDVEGQGRLLRRVKAEEVLRIGLSDIAGELDVEQVCARLTDLADVCVERAFDGVRGALERRAASRGERLAPMTVIGLGKLGGGELGYAADVDLVFVYDGDIGDHEAMSRLAQRFVSALDAFTEEGRLYEVDTRLRPSGRKGTLVSSLAAWRRYHGTAADAAGGTAAGVAGVEGARPWERQALIKARAVAGDAALGAQLEAEIARTVYEAPSPPASELGKALIEMRERMEHERASEGGGRWDVKLGRGGIVDVEFAAQFLQLAHGGAHPELRVRGTLEALRRASDASLLDEHARATLADGYRFLRRLENRMRIVHDRAIHEFPTEPAERDKLARRMGYPTAAALERGYLGWTREVREAFRGVLGA